MHEPNSNNENKNHHHTASCLRRTSHLHRPAAESPGRAWAQLPADRPQLRPLPTPRLFLPGDCLLRFLRTPLLSLGSPIAFRLRISFPRLSLIRLSLPQLSLIRLSSSPKTLLWRGILLQRRTLLPSRQPFLLLLGILTAFREKTPSSLPTRGAAVWFFLTTRRVLPPASASAHST